ncbi:MAG: hypothetical protein Q3966_03995 [Neisseria sp.]|nr:hypothetical protein [Neisseria sp.]
MKNIFLPAALLVLSACALTPEQKAEREAAQQRYRQDLQVALAAQCDHETASLMRRHFDGETGGTEEEKRAFRLAYIDKVNDRMFQACYKMAWQSYTAQQRLNDLRMRDYSDWRYGWYPWGPWWW